MKYDINNRRKPQRCEFKDDSYCDEGSYKTDKSNRCWLDADQNHSEKYCLLHLPKQFHTKEILEKQSKFLQNILEEWVEAKENNTLNIVGINCNNFNIKNKNITGHLNLKSSVFCGTTCFEDSFFAGQVSINDCEFKLDFKINKTSFDYYTSFKNNKFVFKCILFDSRFKIDFDIQNCVFKYHLDIDKCKISSIHFNENEVRFTKLYDSVFLETSNFKENVFSEKMKICNSKFIGKTFWKNNMFNDSTYIYNNTFEENVGFYVTHFSRPVHFLKLTFKKMTEFNNCEFNDYVKISDSDFHNKSSFANSNFQKQTIFKNLQFRKKTIFNRVKFEIGPGIINTVFDISPGFHDCTFGQSVDFSNVKFRDTSSQSAVSDYRLLKVAMNKASNHRKEAYFHSLEQKSLRNQVDVPRNIKYVSWLYEKFSDYGQSFLRPLISFISLNLFCTLVYVLFKLKIKWDSLAIMANAFFLEFIGLIKFSIYNIVSPFKILIGKSGEDIKYYFGQDLTISQEVIIYLVATFQSLFSLVLIALTILAIRRAFKLN